MKPQNKSTYDSARRTCWIYLGILFAVVCILGVLHVFFADLKVGGVRWFNLDKERNIQTWFSGMLFFLMGCAAMVAYAWEWKRNAEGQSYFRLPILWLGVVFVGLLMSLDEITILHENLFWRETRLFSAELNHAWRYVTQWQILLAPAIVLVMGYFVLFFSNRFLISLSARQSAFAGIACWLIALLLEGVRGSFKQAGAGLYSSGVLIEELLEMTGAIFLLASIVFYTIDIALDFTSERRSRLQLASRFLTRQAVIALVITAVGLSLAGGTIYFLAQKQASTGTPLPRLYKKALKSRPKVDKVPPQTKTSQSSVLPATIWFNDIKEPIAITDSEEEALIRILATTIFRKDSTGMTFPAVFHKDKSPRIVFLSVSDGATPAFVVMGIGKGILHAVEMALSRTQKGFAPGYKPTWLKLDIVQDVQPLPNLNISTPLTFERSLNGIAFDKRAGIAFLPEELVAYSLVKKDRIIQRENLAHYLKKRFPQNKESFNFTSANNFTGYRFTTRSLFTDGRDVFALYRGHRFFNRISRDTLLSAAHQGGKYLTNAVGPQGKFVYSYRPRTDYEPEKYNILRHAGTVYSMMELYEITGDTELLQAAQRALAYLVQSARPCPQGDEREACIVERGFVKLGGNGLAVVALAKYTEVTHDQQYMPIMLKLARRIQSVQRESGEFYIHKQAHPGGEVVDFTSTYYPGEALLAMTRIYALDPSESWLDTAEKGAQYLINVRDHGLEESQLPHDHWLLYALNELYRVRQNPLYLNHALRIAHAIVDSQNLNPEHPDWLGSYYRPPRSTPTATRTEGLYAAYKLVRDFGDPREAETIFEAIQRGIRFQLQTQFRPESVLYLQDPQRSLGGFHRSLTNYEIRIDYVQHNISSLLGLYNLMSNQGHRN